MFNWHHHYQPTTNRLCLSLGGQSWQCLLQNTRAWDTWRRGSRWGRTGSWRSRRWPSRRRTKLSTRATPTSTMRATTSTLALAFLSRQWVFCNASHFPTHDSGLVQLSVTFAVNSSLSAQLRRFSLFFFLQTVSYTTPTTNRESVLREIKLGILDRTDLQGHLSLNCIVLEIAIARHAAGIGQ